MTLQALRSISAAHLMANPPPPKSFLLTPWLKERQALMLYAATGVGKSQVAMSIALAVAGGGEVLGWHAPAARPVLFVDGEMAACDLYDRIALLSRTVNPEADAQAWERLHLVARDTYPHGEPFPDIANAEWHTRILEAARGTGAALVVLDNLSTLATIEDENSATAVRGPVALMQALRAAGCTVLLVHHSGKSGEGYRGTSALATVLDTCMGLKPSASAGPGVLDVTLRWDKLRDGANAATVPQRLRLVNEAAGPQWYVGEATEHQAAQLARAIQSLAHTSLRAAGEAIGVKKSRASEVASTMYAEGLLTGKEAEACFAAARKRKREADEDPEDVDAF